MTSQLPRDNADDAPKAGGMVHAGWMEHDAHDRAARQRSRCALLDANADILVETAGAEDKARSEPRPTIPQVRESKVRIGVLEAAVARRPHAIAIDQPGGRDEALGVESGPSEHVDAALEAIARLGVT